jgi:hypothetical protein
LKNESLDLIINIYKANKSQKQNRLKRIAQARENVETIRLLLRLTKDLQIIGIKPFVFLNAKVEDVSVQLVGWQKYMTRVVT